MDYQQQSQHESPTPQQAPVAQDTGVVSNSARLEECGLDTAAPQEEGLFGGFADLVLDAVPMEAALPMAATQISDPGVQQWVLRQDAPRMVQAMARVLPDRLLAQWPVGTGVFLKGSGKVAALFGGTLNGDIELMHTAPGQLRAKTQAGGVFGLENFGAAMKLEGGGDRALGALSMTGGLAAEFGMTGTCNASLDAAMLMVLGAALPPVAMLNILAGSRVVDLAAGAVGLDLPSMLPVADWALEKRAALVARAAYSAGQELPDILSPADVSELMADLKPYLESMNQLFSSKFSGQAELLSGSGCVTVNLRFGLSAISEIAQISSLASCFDIAALQQLSHALEQQGQIELSAGMKLTEGKVLMQPHGRASLTLGSGYNGTSQSDQIHFFLDQIPALVEQLQAGHGLEAMLACAGFDRKVELPAPRELVGQVVPEVMLASSDLTADNGVVAGWEDFNLVGTLSLGPSVLGALVGAGLQPPLGMSTPQALQDLQSALCALVCGLEPAAAWLEPWLLDLKKAVAGVALPVPRLVGRLSFGLGFGASVSGGPSYGGEAKGAAGMVVDREVGQLNSGPLRQALAGL